jgi:hypothetical protein
VIAPAPRPDRPAPAPREIVAELASILATAYLRLRSSAAGRDEVRGMEASAPNERKDVKEQSFTHPPVEPSCDDPAESPPAWRST